MRMGTSILDSLKTVKLMDKVIIHGKQLGKCMTENGTKDTVTVMAFGRMLKETVTQGNGTKVKLLVLVPSLGQMVTDMKVSGICR